LLIFIALARLLKVFCHESFRFAEVRSAGLGGVV
jgi:hypothetical protein